LGAVEPIPARGGGGVLKKTLDRADAIIEALRLFDLGVFGVAREEKVPQSLESSSALPATRYRLNTLRSGNSPPKDVGEGLRFCLLPSAFRFLPEARGLRLALLTSLEEEA